MVLSIDRWRGKVAVVSGASAGIGAVLVEQLVDSGLQVVGLARRVDRVRELSTKLKLKPGKLHPLKCDVANETEVLSAFKWIKDNLGPVHILINNAGLGAKTGLIEGDAKLWKSVLETNVLGLCVCTREAVKDMRANGVAGHVVHVNSVAGHMVPPFPEENVYPASKHAVTALTETLRQELNAIGSKIKITSISPGVVDTDFRPASGREPVAHLIPSLKAEDVCDAILYALSTPPHVQIHELTIKPVGEKF